MHVCAYIHAYVHMDPNYLQCRSVFACAYMHAYIDSKCHAYLCVLCVCVCVLTLIYRVKILDMDFIIFTKTYFFIKNLSES
jgi:hypothetical protein